MVHAYSVYTFCPICVRCNIFTLHIGSCSYSHACSRDDTRKTEWLNSQGNQRNRIMVIYKSLWHFRVKCALKLLACYTAPHPVCPHGKWTFLKRFSKRLCTVFFVPTQLSYTKIHDSSMAIFCPANQHKWVDFNYPQLAPVAGLAEYFHVHAIASHVGFTLQ